MLHVVSDNPSTFHSIILKYRKGGKKDSLINRSKAYSKMPVNAVASTVLFP